MSAGRRRPGVQVFVIGGGFVRLVEALALASGRGDHSAFAWPVELANGERRFVVSGAVHRVAGTERLDIDLRADVHRGHGGACGLVVVDARVGVDAGLRLALVHARREGLHRFVILIEHDGPARGDRVERDVRALLAELGADGDACPVIRVDGALDADAAEVRGWYVRADAAPGDCFAGVEPGRLPPTVRALRTLVAVLDELPAFVAAAPLVEAPPRFAAEATSLEVVRPLYAVATLLRQERGPIGELVQMHGGGGSYGVLVPRFAAVEHACPGCKAAMRLSLQIDTRAFVHRVPLAHHLFRVRGCADCGERRVDHGERTDAALHPDEVPTRNALCLEPAGPAWTLPAPRVLADEHPLADERLRQLGGDDAYARVFACSGADGLRRQWYAGGHRDPGDAGTAVPRCGACEAACVLVVQGGGHERGPLRALWACGEHPERAVFWEHG